AGLVAISVTTTAVAAAVTTAAEASFLVTIRIFLFLVNNDFATINFRFMQTGDSSISSFVVCHFNKTETFRTVVVKSVSDNFCRDHLTIRGEQFLQIIAG